MPLPLPPLVVNLGSLIHRLFAEAVEEALKWAGVEGFSAPGTSTLAEIREALRPASNKANFELDVRIYASF